MTKKSIITTIPGDKSISHRAVILTALSKSTLTFNRFLMSDDCLNTIGIFKECGIDITIQSNSITVQGKGRKGLSKPKMPLYVGNSGTSIRLLTGVFSAQDFDCTLYGDASIANRPMKRLLLPLSKMGAKINAQTKVNSDDNFPPLSIYGKQLSELTYTLPIASAQLKSCLLLAALCSGVGCTLNGETPSRDHTEIMMKGFGINIEKSQSTIYLKPQKEDFYFQATSSSVMIPSDFSSAAFFIVLGLISKQTPTLVLHDIGLNPTRAALLDILMGATLPGSITVFNKKTSLGESIGSIEVSSSSIDNTKLTQSLTKRNLPFLIDEVPILAVAAHFGHGTLTISNAEELRFKESDRISSTVEMINSLGGKAKETKNGLIIEGMMGEIRKDISLNTYNDHRIAMSGFIAGKATASSVKASDTACIATSFPNFFDILDAIPEIN